MLNRSMPTGFSLTMSNKHMITSVLLALAGLLFPLTVRAQYDDSANIQSVLGLTHSLDRSIAIGRPFTFIIPVRYSLSSMDIANLNVYVEEYPQGSGCGGPVHSTNGGSTTQITRGSGQLYARVTWNGSNPVYSDGGFLSIGVTFSDPRTRMVFRSFPKWRYCFPFFP